MHLKCDGTRAETRFRLSAKRKSPFKSAGASVQLTTGSRGVRISGSNAGYTTFRGSVKSTGYSLQSPVSPSLPPLPVRHRVPPHFNWALPPYAVSPRPSLTVAQRNFCPSLPFQSSHNEERYGVNCYDEQVADRGAQRSWNNAKVASLRRLWTGGDLRWRAK